MIFLRPIYKEPTAEQLADLIKLHGEMVELTASMTCEERHCDYSWHRPSRCCKTNCSGYFGIFERLDALVLPIINNMSLDELNEYLTEMYNKGGFWHDECKLPRKMRPFLCIQYYCNSKQRELCEPFHKELHRIENSISQITAQL